jgi:hypothetical protein
LDADEKMRRISESELSNWLSDVRDLSSKRAVRVQLGVDKLLLSLPPGNEFYSNCNLDQIIRALTSAQGSATLRYWALTDRETRLAHEELGDATVVHAESLAWKIAEYYAVISGAIGIDLVNDKVVLNHWPAFSTQAHTSDDLRIAALWMVHPKSITETSTRLQLEQHRVVRFFAGAQAVGLITVIGSRSGSRGDGQAGGPVDPLGFRLRSVFRRARRGTLDE